jgi:hypothetical protein
MGTAGEVEGEIGGVREPGRAEAKEVGPTDAQELGGCVRVEIAAVDSVEGLL